MSRFIKSTNIYVSDQFDCPEKRLFIAILSQAVHDAFSAHVPRLEKQAARNFLTNNSKDFQHICEMAGRSHAYVKEKIRKKVLRDNGWNVDVKIRISSPRRRKQMADYRKKSNKLTGNAYYAAKKETAALSQGTN